MTELSDDYIKGGKIVYLSTLEVNFEKDFDTFALRAKFPGFPGALVARISLMTITKSPITAYDALRNVMLQQVSDYAHQKGIKSPFSGDPDFKYINTDLKRLLDNWEQLDPVSKKDKKINVNILSKSNEIAFETTVKDYDGPGNIKLNAGGFIGKSGGTFSTGFNSPGFSTSKIAADSKKLPGVMTDIEQKLLPKSCDCFRDTEPLALYDAIIHLNDQHGVAREEIADWIDMLHDSGVINAEFEPWETEKTK